MFEAHVLHLLRKYLGEYVEGLSLEALRISVWKGDVVLKDLQLKAEALNALKLPVVVKAGFVGTITLKVPWKSLGKEPVIVLIDRVFVLAHPAPNGYNIKEEDREKLFEAKLRQIEEAESATLEAKLKRAKLGSTPDGNSWLGSLIATIIGNLKISISNVHIRYEDVISNPGHPFCSGVTLAKLAAITVDEEGNETFDTSGALDKLRKSLQLQRLAVYHDSDTLPWKLDKTWEDLSPREWIEIFEDGIGEPVPRDPSSVWSLNRKYLISPINGTLNYHRLGKLERKDPDIPFEKASLILNDVSVTVSEAQYHDGIKVLEAFSKYRIRVDVSHLRPVTSVSDDPGVWWRYAFQASLQQKKLCYRFSWDRIQHLCQLRRRYIQLYASFLQQLCEVDVFEMREIEKDLDSKVILLWRLLAHAKVETKEAAQQKSNLKRSWWSLSWRSSSEDPVVSEGSLESKLVDDEKLTKEEWKAINKLLSYQPEEEVTFYSGKDLQNMVQYSVNIYIERGAARIISCNETEIVCGRFERLQISTKHYHKSINCDVSLRFYGLSAPEGSLVQSVSSKTKVNALEASFLYSPVGENLDWRLSATIAPCHVTVLVESYNRVISFVRSSNTISPTIASETAAALQMKIEKVSRKAQEQLQIVLEEQSRFVLDVDFDAPKVMVPMMKHGFTVNKGNFLIDFGHFTLHTREGERGEQSQTQYSRFYILGRDIAAFFLDNCSNRDRGHVVPSIFTQEPSSPLIASDDDDSFLALIDRCGMAVVIDQIKLPHPGYPSTQVSVQVPLLGIHFSPKRYSRLLDLMNILYNAMDNGNSRVDQYLQSFVVCQNPGDLTSNARILVWGGIGNSIAEWKPCFLVLSGIYIYVLESELSQTYQRCASLAGRQVIEVSPASVGGSLFCLAVCVRGTDVQKALESSNTLILEFQHDDEKVTWLRRLTQAIYGASSPVSIDPLEDQSQELPDYRGTEAVASEAPELVVNCALVQTKIMVYGQVPTGQVKNEDETLILEVLAGGAKVNLVCVRDDLNVKMKLHSLKVKDELQSWHSASAQYLACSVLKNKGSSTSFVLDSNSDEIPITVMEEDDIFRDALPDFSHTTEHIFYSHSSDTPRATKHGLLDLSPRSFAADFYETLHFDKEMLDGEKKFNEDFCDTHDIEESDFVSVTFTTRSCGSLFYDGIDTQMNIRMSKLDFYCSRPTLVALIDFGIELSLVAPRLSSTTGDGVSGDSQGKEHAYVKGLLGYGKSRTVFCLKMDVDSVCIYLNDEAGSQLAMFVQERFMLDLKVHPSSLSIEGKLGNLRLCNMALGPDHCWGWLCDMRNQNTESLVEFTFQSYSQDDDDYEGVDYSLSGRLSAVRIVFLYKFVQEIAAYFMELATPHTEEAIKFVDKVGGFEWLIQKYEIEGAPAIKLDISLDTPIIIVPRNSTSNEFMQLDLGQLELKNNFSWHGSEKDTSSVHLDTLEAEIHGINMAVGAKGSLGKPMLRRGEQISIKIRRSLRDVFRKVPTFSLEIKVGLLHAVMSDKEYNVILDCLYMNLLEEPSLPPSFRSTNTQLNDSMRLLADKVNLQSQMLLSRTVSVMVVEVTYALLELCNGIDEESPLAHLALEDLWVSYRTTSLSEVDLYMTIPKFSVLDVRPGSKPEMQLMLGSASDLSKQGSGPILSFPPTLPDEPTKSSDEAENLNLSMLLVDYRVRSNSESFVIRIQQPRILVVLDFLLGVCEFFVPALGSITGHEETLDPRNDPLTRTGNIVLSEPVYEQEDDVIYLSSNCQLIVDSAKANEFVYDGGGKKICLVSDYLQKEVSPAYIPPIIIIGRGKKLRFKNVIIENGTLLSKCTYLGNGSSYSVSVEDGVNVSLGENSNSDSSCRFDVLQETSNMPTVSSPLKGGSASQMRNFTFEAQVVSPEFTFYDSTKLSSTQALHVEKLLRAKLDLSFMYAFKESDTWVRAFLKDVTIESGSGLVVLDPVDIYGGFTSVKDKTNIYVASTDICLHLSLSVISLVLHLQDEANAALQYGNAKPLATCINFDRIWVSPKAVGNECGSFFAFWRPQAPPNYVILSDCVTSRPTPPSQAVMAVSNIYGRVKKPIGFELIGFYSSVLGYQCDAEDDCSLWLPIAPLGYSAVGCVANKGRRPPSNHVVFCLRTDLLTSTTFSECYLCVPPVLSLPSGFSIWRVDNALGSFIAHFSVEFPAQMCAYELHQMLFANPCWPTTSKNTENFLNDNQLRNKNRGDVDSGSAGWKVLRSISKSGDYCISTPHFERIWWDKGCDTRKSVSIWRPIPRPGFSILGDCITEGLEPPALGLVYKCDNSGVSAHPIQFTKVAYVAGRGFEEAFFWYPIAPPGYTSMGCIVSKVDEAPSLDSLCCPRMDLVQQANVEENPISRSMSSKISNCWSIWKVESQAGTFLARSDLKKPSNRLAYSIGSCVKPRTREDISGEMKLPYFSLTILDSLYGMMRPLCDITITNMNLASHGCMESMNAVLVSSIAASTFNTQLEAWEPFIEPFDGIFKFETYETDHRFPLQVEKKVRIAATSILNFNFSAANLDTIAESILSWKRQRELEWKSTANEEPGIDFYQKDLVTVSALKEDEFQKLTIENKLGCDIYLKKYEDNSEVVALVRPDECASALLPPQRFSDRLNVVAESKNSRCYIAIHIYEARGLQLVDDGNSHDFFCAVRLVVDGQSLDQRRLFSQSARTRAVKPLVIKANEMSEVVAKWNEVFIFEVPKKGLSRLEVEVTNLASRAGKGEVIGAFSISVGNSSGSLKRVPSVHLLNQSVDIWKITAYPLERRGQISSHDGRGGAGVILVSTCLLEKKFSANFQRQVENVMTADNEVGFWIGLHPEGPWESFRSVLPLSVAPRTMDEHLFAFEVVTKNGKKHAILRSLGVVVNDTDVVIEVCLCPVSAVVRTALSKLETNNAVLEEVFENQHYHPVTGWRSKLPSSRDSEPQRWSTRNFSFSSKDFFEPSIPPGWQWVSGWTIEKSQCGDSDGWIYGPDYASLKWPPSSLSSSKLSQDCVRRRRWIRPRKKVDDKISDNRNVFARIQPKSSTVLPWKSMFKDVDVCLQFRPHEENSQTRYMWAHSCLDASAETSQLENISGSTFKLNKLEKKDLLFCSTHATGSNKKFWLSVGADASVLQTELNSPVYDWKISVNAPLKLENKLPSEAEYSVWEGTKEGKIEKHRGVVSSGSSVLVYSVDVQRPIYLTLYIKGGWILEKDPIPISDFSSPEHVSYFWMVNQQKKRRLRVSIERDLGASNTAAKTIRFYVPYWIANDTSLSLVYRMVEVDSPESAEIDSSSLSRTVKSAKLALKRPTSSPFGKTPSSRKNIQILESIDESDSEPIMLSPHEYLMHNNILSFSPRNDSFLSPRIGLSVALRHCEHYSSGISLLDLENKEKTDVKAINSDGSYYKLSVMLKMVSNRTKVIHFRPQTVLINRTGCSLFLQQVGADFVEIFEPTDPPKVLQWQPSLKSELLKLRLNDFRWSSAFSIQFEGAMCLPLKSETGSDQMFVRVEVRSGTKQSRYEVIFRPHCFSSPYRIENRSAFLHIRVRQVHGTDNSWQPLSPNSASPFFWEDLGRQRLLEISVDGNYSLRSQQYNIDEVADHQPIEVHLGPMQALRVTVDRVGKINVVRISDWMPVNESPSIFPRTPTPLPQFSHDAGSMVLSSSSMGEIHFIVEVAELGLSVVDHTPEEILYLSLQNVLLSYSTGLGSGISRFKLRVLGIQLDNQLPLTPMPVLFRPQRFEGQSDYVLKFSVTMQSNGAIDLCAYPYIGLQAPENLAFLINVHEPIIWRLHEMIQYLKPTRISSVQSHAVSVDPTVQIRLLNVSEIRFKISLAMSPSQRPRGVLGFWSSLMTALGNTENMTIKMNQRFLEDVCMCQSALISAALSNIQKDLLSQPLQLLSGVDILGNASSALGHMSKGVAALSMDKKFIQSRQRQENKGVEAIGDVIREGGGAFAMGLFRGVTGILTKPLEGAKSSGVEGFVQGVGKGIIGAAAQPVSGVLDLLSKTTEGANAMRMKIMSAITSEEQLLRRRLPRVIGGDNLLRPYNEYNAQGQVILQLAECGSFFGQVDLFKVRGKFALSDAYENHFMLPEGKIVVITHRRVLLLQQPANIVIQRKFNPVRDPCAVLWDVSWDDLSTMEILYGKKDDSNSRPSQLVLYLYAKAMDSKDSFRVLKCNRDSQQAFEIYCSIDQALSAYGPKHAKDMIKKKVLKPYAPRSGDTPSDIVQSVVEDGLWSLREAPSAVSPSSTFGTVVTQPLSEQREQ